MIVPNSPLPKDAMGPQIHLSHIPQLFGDISLRKVRSDGLFSNLLRIVRQSKESLAQIVKDAQDEGRFDLRNTTPEHVIQLRKIILEQNMRDAKVYDDWFKAAQELDVIEENDDWKATPESDLYDCQLIQQRIQDLQRTIQSKDIDRMLYALRTAVARDVGNMSDLRLYKHSHLGTKNLIDDYISTACCLIDTLVQVLPQQEDNRHVLEQLQMATKSYGRTALMLSGGATFGMMHIGVVKALWENNLLPKVISGSSAGSIISAVLCARTDDEIPETISEMCFGEFDVFEKRDEAASLLGKVQRLFKSGSVFDSRHLIDVMRGLLGNLTFHEAFNRTGRILNISVSSSSHHEMPRLLNYMTTPEVIIWSAVAASCAVPVVFAASSIVRKDPKTGQAVPWDPHSHPYIDGSVDSDLPMGRLSEMFNVNHFIVSQVNPHVVPFLIAEETMVQNRTKGGTDVPPPTGSGMVTGFTSFARDEALHRLQILSEMGVFAPVVTLARKVIDQTYCGDITILPEITLNLIPKVLTNPSKDFMQIATRLGERATWPKLSRIRNQLSIEIALEKAIDKIREQITFTESQVNLRLAMLDGTHRHPDSLRIHGSRRRRPRNHTRHRSDPALSLNLLSRQALALTSAHRDSDSNVDTDGATDEGIDPDEGYLSMRARRPRRRGTTPTSPSSGPSSEFESPSPQPPLEPQPQMQLPPLDVPPVTASQPATPAGRQSWLGMPDLTMTSSVAPATNGRMSEPERRYKELFHGLRNLPEERQVPDGSR